MSLEIFGSTQDGRTVHRITLSSGDLTVSILTLGAIIQDVRISGVDHSLTLGSQEVAAYEGPMEFYGAIVGPVANRIANASAMVAGQKYSFDANENGVTTLHSGSTGTHAQNWTLNEHGKDFAILGLHLPDGFGGFPGNRDLTAHYQVTGPASLTLALTGTTDSTTIMNLANHSYWNLNGTTDTAGHDLMVLAGRYLPTDDRLIPTGVCSVTGSGFDFRIARSIGTGQPDRIDHALCLDLKNVAKRNVAMLSGTSGVSMALGTTAPGLQVYDGENNKTAPFIGFHGHPYGPLSGIALEAQGWPDAPNRPEFPSVALEPSQTYRQVTSWRFSQIS